MNWNRDLDQVEAKALHDLHAKGYNRVDKKHMIHFKTIYDFISRFADPTYAGDKDHGVLLRMSTGEQIPSETKQIVNTIGADRLYLFFSPHAYLTNFLNFCEKLIRTKRIRSSAYLAIGEIIASRYEVEETAYEDIPF